jgi:hypothetical protein
MVSELRMDEIELFAGNAAWIPAPGYCENTEALMVVLHTPHPSGMPIDATGVFRPMGAGAAALMWI